MKLPLCVVTPCKVRVGIRFFTTQNKSAIEIHREMCSCHCRNSCIDIQLLYAERTSLLNFNSWFVLNCAHLARHNYMQQKLHFQYCVLHIFVKRLPCNFYSVSRNSKIMSPCNFTSIGSQNSEKKNRKTYFWDESHRKQVSRVNPSKRQHHLNKKKVLSFWRKIFLRLSGLSRKWRIKYNAT